MATVTLARPTTELSVVGAYQFALKWQVIGLLLLASHIILTRQSVVLFPLTLLAIGWLYARAPLAGVAVFFQFLIYQNWMISLFVNGMDREPTFVLLQGTNFAILMLMGAVAWIRLYQSRWRQVFGTTLTIITTTLVLIVLYTMLGAAKEGATSASIYFRLAATIALGTLVGLDIGRVWGYRTIGIVFVVSAVLSMLLAIVEEFATETYYDSINAVQFMALKTLNDPKYDAFWSVKNVVAHSTNTLFNISDLDIEQLRFNGTVMHPISYAYILAVVGLVAWSIRQGGWLFLAFPLMVASGGKGGNLLFICSISVLTVWYITRSRPMLLVCGGILAVAYVGFGLLLGMDGGDYHVLGFLGGVHGFINNPAGHGIGVGGNLSRERQNGFAEMARFPASWDRRLRVGISGRGVALPNGDRGSGGLRGVCRPAQEVTIWDPHSAGGDAKTV